MHLPDTSAPAFDRQALPPRLSGTIEGVEFWIALPRGKQMRCVITESALQAHFGAKPGDTASWLEAFIRHRVDIERHALAATALREDVHVVLVSDSTGRLKSAVGRCKP